MRIDLFETTDPVPTLTDLERALHPSVPYRTTTSKEKVVTEKEILFFPSGHGTLNGEDGMAFYRFLGGTAVVTHELYKARGVRFVTCNLNSSMDQPWFNYEVLKAMQPILLAAYGDRQYQCFAWYQDERLWKPWRD